MPKRDFKGKVVLVTAGGTREPLDAVRFITNASSGKMGLALAKAAHGRKARVIFITAAQDCPAGLPFKTIRIDSAREMFKEVKSHFLKADIIIMAAAVADFRPEKFCSKKIKKENHPELLLKLIRNPDILSWLGRRKRKKILVGFCAETKDLIKQAQKKLQGKNADLIVGVNLRQLGGVIGKDFARVQLVAGDGRVTSIPRRKKEDIAHLILDEVSALTSS